LAVEALSNIERVTVCGNVAGQPLKRSKLEVLPDYRFNVCFEHSLFPGYYTEKVLHAWASGCVPLYFADPFFSKDFNPLAVINRADFATLEDFVEYVRRINGSSDAQSEIVCQPLVRDEPSLDQVINFIRRSYEDIRSIPANRAVGVTTPFPNSHDDPTIAPNAYCPCGSGRKFRRCHGRNVLDEEEIPIARYYFGKLKKLIKPILLPAVRAMRGRIRKRKQW
jgi:hypothetical protein